MANHLFGFDVSQYQRLDNGKIFPLHLMKKQGYSFLTARTSVGLKSDTLFPHFRRRASYHKIPFAAYHYLLSGIPAYAQARLVKKILGRTPIPLMVDVEDGSGNICDVRSFVESCNAIGVNVQSLYLPHWYWERAPFNSESLSNVHGVKDLALVASNYGANNRDYGSRLYPGNDSSRWSGYGGRNPEILQFGSRIKLDGWPADLDGDAFRGTEIDLRKSGLFHFWK